MDDSSDTPPEAVYEMLWDCRYCGASKLLGVTHRHCPQCGGAQDPSWRYFPSDQEKVLAKDHRYVGVDKLCSYCGTANSAAAKCCGQCGAALDEAAEIKPLPGRARSEGVEFQTEDLQARQRGIVAPTAPPPPAPSRLKYVVGAILTIVAGVIAAVFWTKTTEVTVLAQRWNREISLEVLKPVSQSSWCDSVPSDAYGLSRRRQQRDTREVPDGEECSTQQIDRGDGSFVEREVCHTRYRSEAIYDDRCSYTVNRWVPNRVAQLAGASLADLAWPSAQPVKAGNCLGCEREGPRQEHYTVELGGLKRPTTCELPQAVWQKAQVGAKFRLKVGAVIGDARCDSLELIEP